MTKVLWAHSASPTREFNCDLRRLVPSRAVADGTPWGAAWATVHPGDATTAHAHDEDEVFLILGGAGRLVVAGEPTVLSRGDFVRIPRDQIHSIHNDSEDTPLEFVTIYWGERAAYYDQASQEDQAR